VQLVPDFMKGVMINMMPKAVASRSSQTQL
jgi:hypothetical protein